MELMATSIDPLERARSAEPYVNYSRLSKSMPRVSSNHLWLEELQREGLLASPYLEDTLERWSRASPATNESMPNHLSEEEVFGALATIFEYVKDTIPRGPISSIDRRIMMDLERARERDHLGLSLLRLDGASYAFTECQRLFRSFAEASHYYRSRALADVLYLFFVHNLPWIANQHSTYALLQWCEAILRSNMKPCDKVLCLQSLSQFRPEIPTGSRPSRRGDMSAAFDHLRAAIDVIQDNVMGDNPRYRRSHSAERVRERGGARRTLGFRRNGYGMDEDSLDSHLELLEDNIHGNMQMLAQHRRGRMRANRYRDQLLLEGSSDRDRDTFTSPLRVPNLLQ